MRGKKTKASAMKDASIISYSTDVKKIIKGYYEQLYIWKHKWNKQISWKIKFTDADTI